MAERMDAKGCHWRVATMMAVSVAALVPAIATAPEAIAAQVVVGSALPHPPGVSGPMVARGVSRDGRYVAYEIAGASGRYDRVADTFVSRTVRNLSADGVTPGSG